MFDTKKNSEPVINTEDIAKYVQEKLKEQNREIDFNLLMDILDIECDYYVSIGLAE
jgi:flavodoxin